MRTVTSNRTSAPFGCRAVTRTIPPGAAAAVAKELGGVAVAAMPEPVPTETGKLGEASVLILLGTDIAGIPLPAAGTAAAPVAPVVTIAPVAPVAPTTTTG